MNRPRLFPIKRQTAPGASPGTVIAPPDSLHPVVDILAYGKDNVHVASDVSVADIEALRDKFDVIWVNVAGLGNADLIIEVGKIFSLHRLAMEDVVNLHQRPKAEEFDDHIFIISRMFRSDTVDATEQIAIFLGDGFVLTFQEKAGDCFDPLRKRIENGTGRVRQCSADYLCYALLDAVIDDYFPVLERYGEELEVLEDGVVSNASQEHVSLLHQSKRELLSIRRAVWPHREMINTLVRDQNPLITAETMLYLRDVYDHSIQLMDIVETYREIASGLVDVYISSVSAKLNEIMKVLTIIATIFIPLGFIASLYGMNFDRSSSAWNMPELGWRFGYLFSLGLMTAVALGLLVYFRSKGWLGARTPRDKSDDDVPDDAS